MTISQKRKEINDLDSIIVGLLDRRAAISNELTLIKLNEGLPIIGKERESELVGRLLSLPVQVIDDSAIERIFRAILDESCRLQEKAREEIDAELCSIENQGLRPIR
jgi:chorismate mutase